MFSKETFSMGFSSCFSRSLKLPSLEMRYKILQKGPKSIEPGKFMRDDRT